MASSDQNEGNWAPAPLPAVCDDEPGYLNQAGEQLYFMRHPALGTTRARVLVLGPFANERTCSAMAFRRWAQRMAAAGLEVMRFDYRGVGESTGDFGQQGLDEWLADARAAFTRIGSADGLPTFLNGLRLGALLGSHLFADGLGDGLLMWDPPTSAKDMLMSTLRVRLTIDMTMDPEGKRTTRDQYVQMIEAGQFVDVEGFRWGKRLWESAARFQLKLPAPGERPFRVIHLEKRPESRVASPGHSDVIPVPAPPFWQMAPVLSPNLDPLFDRSLQLLDTWIAAKNVSA